MKIHGGGYNTPLCVWINHWRRPCKIFLSSSLTGVQNMVVVCHSAWSYVGCARNLERWNPAPWEVDLADPVERRPPCMRHVPNLVVVHQTAGAYVLQRFVGKLTPSVPPFSVTRSATYDFLLVIHSNGPIHPAQLPVTNRKASPNFTICCRSRFKEDTDSRRLIL